MILEVKHLRLVEALADHGSLTNASKHLNLTQSALSHQLNELERRLGTPLFHRVGRRLVPTHAGTRLLRGASRSLDILRRTESALRRIAAGHDAVLRFSTGCYTTYHWLAPLLTDFTRRCPKVEVRLVAEATKRPIEALLGGEIDVGIISGEIADDRIQLSPLFEDEMVMVVAPNHPLATREFVLPRDFADQHLLVYTEPRSDNNIFSGFLDPAGVVPRRVSPMMLTEVIAEMVKAGMGVAGLARWAIEPYLRSGALVAIPLGADGVHRTWYAATLQHQATALHIREFCKLLERGPEGLRTASAMAELGA